MQKSSHTRQYRVSLDWLIEARKDADLTQQQVADKLGCPTTKSCGHGRTLLNAAIPALLF